MRLLNFILLLVLSVNVSWGYAYDPDLNILNHQVIDLELQNQYYDATSNLCNSGNECLHSYLQKKALDGSFFTFEVGLVATKGLKNTGPLKNTSGSLDDAANAARTQPFGGRLSVQFGNNANQVSHAFRHADKVGLSRGSVQSAISRDLSQNGHLLRTGSNTRTVNVGGIDLTFNAHRLSNGTVNVGRITPPRQ